MTCNYFSTTKGTKIYTKGTKMLFMNPCVLCETFVSFVVKLLKCYHVQVKVMIPKNNSKLLTSNS